MRVLFHSRAMLDAFGLAGSVVPTSSPNAIILNALLTVTEDDATLTTTNMETAIHVRVRGVKCDRPGRALLPYAKLMQILRTSSNEEELAVEVYDGKVTIRGLRSQFKLASEDPNLFPSQAIGDFKQDGEPAIRMVAGDLRSAIKRTVVALDEKSTRYALGGVLFAWSPRGQYDLVATDGRIMAKVPARIDVGEPSGFEELRPVVPAKALTTLGKVLANVMDDEFVLVNLSLREATFHVPGHATIQTRLLEGRFPDPDAVIPTGHISQIVVNVGEFRSAVSQASVATSMESCAVTFVTSESCVKVSAVAADVGSAAIEIPASCSGPSVAFALQPRLAMNALTGLDPESELLIDVIDAKSAVLFRPTVGGLCVVMPITLDR